MHSAPPTPPPRSSAPLPPVCASASSAGGYTVAGPVGSVGLRAVQNGGEIVRHANGVSQTTDFGNAAVVVDAERTEQFLTVTRRQGKHTWRWQLDTSLAPRVGNDGAVVFLSNSSRRVAGPVLAPVQILDARGRNVTPEGARWSTGLNRKGWELRLTIDDSELPLPYVIDPAVTHRATTVSNNAAAGAANITLTYPAGVAVNDLLVATIAVRGGVAVNTPGGWAAGRSSQNGANVRLVTFYKVATASEPASQSFTWTGTQQAVGAISAYYGIKASLGNAGILDVMSTANTGNSATASANSITTTTANALLVASFGTNNNDTFGAVTGMTERWDAASANGTPANRASGAQSDSTQVAAGATGAKTSALAGTRQWAAHLHSFEVDNVNPIVTPTIPAVIRGTFTLTSTVSDADSGIMSVLYEGSPAGAGTWVPVGTSLSCTVVVAVRHDRRRRRFLRRADHRHGLGWKHRNSHGVDDPRRQLLARSEPAHADPAHRDRQPVLGLDEPRPLLQPDRRRHVLALERPARRLAPDLVRRRQRRRQQQQPAYAQRPGRRPGSATS